jgi:hypothetical protein
VHTFSHAAEAISFSVSSAALTTDSFSGLSVTAVTKQGWESL